MSTIVTTAALGDWGANQALNYLYRQQGQLWLALHDADPLGALPNEVAGGGYSRQPISFAVPSGRTVVSSNAQTFHGLPVDTVPYLAVWTDISTGNVVGVLYLGSHALHTTDSGQIKTAAGDVAFGF